MVADGGSAAERLGNAVAGAIRLQVVDANPSATVVARIETAGAFDVLLCEFSPASCDERAALVQMLVERFAPVPVVGIALGEEPKLASAAMRARARDFFVLGRDDQRLAAWFERLLQGRSSALPAPSASSHGRIFTVLSGHPYDGIAFLADHLAVALQERVTQDERVLLLDLATPQGAGAIFLNQNPAYSALDALADVQRCDRKLIDSSFSRHASGVYVLSLPENLLGRPQIDADRLLQLLHTISGLFVYTVVAIDGHHALSTLARVVDRADRTLLLSDQSILKTRQSKYLLQALRDEDCTLERTGLIVDNYKSRLGLEPKNIAELYRLPLLGTLQTESYNRIVAMNAGEPLFAVAPKDPYCSGVRELAATLCGGKPVVPVPALVRKRWKLF
jgi:pilus assembly protein CpaE